MTITKGDIKQFERETNDFKPQHQPTDCLPTALTNMLNELADRHDVSGLEMSLSELNEICQFMEGMGGTSEDVPAVLGAEIEDFGYTVKEQKNTSIKELDETIQDGTCSYPAVELDPDYFNTFENWDPQAGRRGHQLPHVIIPYKINSEEILYYEPYCEMMTRSGAVSEPKKRMDQPEFFELWSGRSHPRWTMWIEQMEQQTLNAAINQANQ